MGPCCIYTESPLPSVQMTVFKHLFEIGEELIAALVRDRSAITSLLYDLRNFLSLALGDRCVETLSDVLQTHRLSHDGVVARSSIVLLIHRIHEGVAVVVAIVRHLAERIINVVAALLPQGVHVDVQILAAQNHSLNLHEVGVEKGLGGRGRGILHDQTHLVAWEHLYESQQTRLAMGRIVVKEEVVRYPAEMKVRLVLPLHEILKRGVIQILKERFLRFRLFVSMDSLR